MGGLVDDYSELGKVGQDGNVRGGLQEVPLSPLRQADEDVIPLVHFAELGRDDLERGGVVVGGVGGGGGIVAGADDRIHSLVASVVSLFGVAGGVQNIAHDDWTLMDLVCSKNIRAMHHPSLLNLAVLGTLDYSVGVYALINY